MDTDTRATNFQPERTKSRGNPGNQEKPDGPESALSRMNCAVFPPELQVPAKVVPSIKLRAQRPFAIFLRRPPFRHAIMLITPALARAGFHARFSTNAVHKRCYLGLVAEFL